MTTSDSSPPEQTENNKRRYSRSEMEVACIEAHTAGRLYAASGEKLRPDEEWRQMLKRAIGEAERYRKEMHKLNRCSRIPPEEQQ